MHGIIGDFLASDPVRGVIAIGAFFAMLAIFKCLSGLALFGGDKPN
ncbi:MAG: hypothetical protein AAF660_13355 [Pseudomonadota bacterium]